MKSYQLYIFDVDDTLINTFEATTTNYYPKLAQTFGAAYPGNEAVREHWGEELLTSLENIFGIKIDERTAIGTLETLFQENPIEALGGTRQVLSILKKHGKYVGLYSSCYPTLLELSIKNSLAYEKKYIDFIFSTVEQQIAKPSPHIAFIIMDKCSKICGKRIELDEVLVIGDSVADFIMAKNAGVDFAGVLTGPTSREEFLGAGVDSKCFFRSVTEALVPPSQHGIVAVIKNERGEFLLIKESRSDNPYYGHWSGPHGLCNNEDIIEEETVVRETWEECGVEVEPIRKLWTCPADTRVNTVSFWEARIVSPQNLVFNRSRREVGALGWFPLDKITNGSIPLYPGTKNFFGQYRKMEGRQNGRKE